MSSTALRMDAGAPARATGRRPMDVVVDGLTKKSDKIRALFSAGYERVEIRRYLDVSYQHVRGVLVSSGFKEVRPPQPLGDGATPDSATPRPSDASPPVRTRVVVGPGGRVVIPAPFREALGVAEGDAVFMCLDGEELRVVSDAVEVRQVREMIARHAPEDVSLVDELIRERRREAAADEAR